MQKFALICFCCLISNTTYTQIQQRIGEWRSFLPQQFGRQITQTPEKVVYANSWNLILINKGDLSVEFISKVEGLSDHGISNVTYDPFNDQLFVIYNNSNIDILQKDRIVNIPNIRSNTNISGDKSINDVFVFNENRVFFSTSFGIVEFDPSTLNFGNTTITGVEVNQVGSFNNQLIAATADGAYTVSLGTGINIGDFAQWQLLSESNGLPSLYTATSVTEHAGQLYLAEGNHLYKSNDGRQFQQIYETADRSFLINFLSHTNDRLIVGTKDPAFASEVLFFDADDNFITEGGGCTDRVNDAIRDEQGRIWYADDFNEIRIADNYEAFCNRLNYNSPFSHQVSDIAIKDDLISVASGGVSESFLFLFTRFGFYVNENGNWTNYNETGSSFIKDNDILSFFRTEIHPSKNIVYSGSYWAGLTVLNRDDNEFTLYDQTNSSLRGAVGDEARERVTGLAFDQDENLWVSTYAAPRPLNVMTTDGEWTSFNVGSGTTLTDLAIDLDGFKWSPIFGNSGGILVYDSGESIQSTADDQRRIINSFNSEITTNLVNSVATDLNGAVWVGTAEGPVIFDCGEDVFDAALCPGVRRKVVQDNIPAFLLADQDIRSIAVDGANRKWFGTRNGIFVQSPDGTEQIHHFTEENSPLFDNQIQSMAYEENTGIMYIGTNRGMLSYRTASAKPEAFQQKSKVFAFPNPVRPEYLGPIAIKGLVDQALVQITDINGQLVKETQSLGGQAIWDGTDLQGQKVAAGVYLVFSSEISAFDQPDSFVTKVMVLR